MITVAITGACGRMGMRLVALAKQSGEFEVVGAIDKPDSPHLATDAGEIAGAGKIGVPITYDLKKTPQVLIDFTGPAGMRHWLKACHDRKIAMVIGSTGLSDKDQQSIDIAAADIPILQATNMSLGVAVLCKVAGQMAQMLGDDYDIEVLEGHHRFKKDAPSGTAATIAESILAATGKGKDKLVYGRHGDDVTRQRGTIGMHSLRMGDEVGKHTVYFAALGERLELGHVATNRDTFVHGALRAAKWLVGKKPGRYAIADVVGVA